MDRETLLAYDGAAAAFAEDWHRQPAPGIAGRDRGRLGVSFDRV